MPKYNVILTIESGCGAEITQPFTVDAPEAYRAKEAVINALVEMGLNRARIIGAATQRAD